MAAVAGAAVGGCAGNGPTFPGLPELTGSLSGASIVGSPTEVYERIARGALSCWFGAAGPLKANYVYHAEADPPGKGGKAEISIHERNRIYDTPKGMRAYRITIAAEKEMATLAFENLKLPEPLAASMEADARRWGSGAIGCAEAKAGGWSENTPPPASSLPPEGKKKPAPKGN
ncbi:MAG: hypothetical protein WDN31_16450 [Hyphomicrobium sp.]